MGINLASYVGATQVRRVILGDADVQPTAAQLEQMKSLVREAMRTEPSASPPPLNMLPRPMPGRRKSSHWPLEASSWRRLCDPHAQRRDAIMTALDETLRIGKEAQIPVESGTSKLRQDQLGPNA